LSYPAIPSGRLRHLPPSLWAQPTWRNVVPGLPAQRGAGHIEARFDHSYSVVYRRLMSVAPTSSACFKRIRPEE
jgi:hypothetical protein